MSVWCVRHKCLLHFGASSSSHEVVLLSGYERKSQVSLVCMSHGAVLFMLFGLQFGLALILFEFDWERCAVHHPRPSTRPGDASATGKRQDPVPRSHFSLPPPLPAAPPPRPAQRPSQKQNDNREKKCARVGRVGRFWGTVAPASRRAAPGTASAGRDPNGTPPLECQIIYPPRTREHSPAHAPTRPLGNKNGRNTIL